MARFWKALSFSNVVACLALFVALGGSVYAAGKISGKEIKRSSLPGNRLKPKTVTARRIKPGTLTGRQIRPHSLTGNEINQKSLTEISAAGLANVQYEAVTVSLPTSGRPGTTATANCPQGAYAIGGGATVSDDDEATVNDSGPSPLRTGWSATAFAWFSEGQTMTVTAVCVFVEKPGGTVTTQQQAPSGGPQYQPAG
ncbi:MAG: hypothetical protein WA687_03050 [Solirubrobacterales bacterium]